MLRVLEESRIYAEYDDTVAAATITTIQHNSILTIGPASIPVNESPDNPELIPDPTFFDIPQHLHLLSQLLADFSIGEHLLLIGNQGVGKNKLADRLLQLMKRPREYVQLHRDTTVQTLTLSPSLQSGVIVWQDSPLVRSLMYGRILMVDEIDKASLEVVCVLKGLIEDGFICLPGTSKPLFCLFARKLTQLSTETKYRWSPFRVVEKCIAL